MAWQTSSGSALSLLGWLCHLPGLRVATMLVIKRWMVLLLTFIPLPGGYAMERWPLALGALALLLVLGLSKVPLHRGRPGSDALSQSLFHWHHCWRQHQNHVGPLCCDRSLVLSNTVLYWTLIQYAQLWWHLWRATRWHLQLTLHQNVPLPKAFFFFSRSQWDLWCRKIPQITTFCSMQQTHWSFNPFASSNASV